MHEAYALPVSAHCCDVCASSIMTTLTDEVGRTADRREFIKISQAVGMGFLIMGVIGYAIKLSESTHPAFKSKWSRDWMETCVEAVIRELTTWLVHIPVNQILVGAA